MPGFTWLIAAAVWLISGLLGLIAGGLAGGPGGKFWALLSLLLTAAASGLVLGLGINLLSILFLALSLYIFINCSRILTGRLQKNNLRRSAVRATFKLWLMQLIVFTADCYWPPAATRERWLLGLAASQLLVALLFLVSFLRQYRLSRYQPRQLNVSDSNLPTLTVAIPAKNETSELEACLNSVLASDYPKLEVLVLDDAAGNRTGEIINGLAHDGVRFILGEPPDRHWLAKNKAYDRLSQEANGQLILFCGVDARFERSSLRALVLELLASKKRMLSVMPINTQRVPSLLVQPMRYFWELARPRLGLSMPVLSTCWLMQRRWLEAAGGFAAVKREIVPERYFASFCSARGGYKFIRSGKRLGVTSEKTAKEQRRTAIRTRYPLLHRRLATVAEVSLFNVFYLLGPLAILVITLVFGWSRITEGLSAAAVLIWLIIYAAIIKSGFRATVWAGFVFVLAVLVDLWLLNLSFVKYEFGKVMWKGRDVAS